MPLLIEWALLTFGLVYLGTAASITAGPRAVAYRFLPRFCRGVLACAPCFSFWVGLVTGWRIGHGVLSELILSAPWWLGPPVGGVMAVGLISFIQGATGWFIAELGNNED